MAKDVKTEEPKYITVLLADAIASVNRLSVEISGMEQQIANKRVELLKAAGAQDALAPVFLKEHRLNGTPIEEAYRKNIDGIQTLANQAKP